jgi:CheY-like chemotaxis protein
LRAAGFAVTAVPTGADAVVAAVEGHFDGCLLDMYMPGLDGMQTIRVLRRVMPQLPILGLTGYVGHGYMAQAAALGITCLNKPIEVGVLLKEIREMLKAARR